MSSFLANEEPDNRTRYKGENMSILFGVSLFLLGGFMGVATMCILQVGAAAEKDSKSYLHEEIKNIK